VERWDFTKGIVERGQALEAYLDRHPKEQGRVTLLQVAEPSRSKLPAYRAIQERTILEVDRINARFQTASWRPIILVPAHQDPRRVFEMYRAADFLHHQPAARRQRTGGQGTWQRAAGKKEGRQNSLKKEVAASSGHQDDREEGADVPDREENNVYRWARGCCGHCLIRQRQSIVPARTR
jgi:hypothetical protein